MPANKIAAFEVPDVSSIRRNHSNQSSLIMKYANLR